MKIRNVNLNFISALFLSFTLSSCGFFNNNEVNTKNLGIYKGKTTENEWNQIQKDKKNVLNVNVLEIEIDKKNTNKIFIGATTGIFLSEDKGKNWNKKESPLKYVSNIEISENDTDIIFASGVNFSNIGTIIKSEDGGETWETSRVLEKRNRKPVKALSIHPNDPNTVLFGTGRGKIYRSQNGGVSWEIIEENIDSNAIQHLEFDQNISDIVYMLVEDQGFFISKNVGEDFSFEENKNRIGNEILSELPDEIQNQINDNLKFYKEKNFYDFEQIQGASGTFFVLTLKRLYLTEDFGQNWKEIKITNSNLGKIYSVAVDPNNKKEYFIGSESSIFKTSDNGITWNKKTIESFGKGGFRDIAFTNDRTPEIFAGANSNI